MDPYWMFLKTLVHTVASLMGAAAVLFTAAASPDGPTSAAPSFRRAALSVALPAPCRAVAQRLAGVLPDEDCDPGVAAELAQTAPPELDTTVIDALIGALGDTDAGVRRHAAIALGEIGEARAVKPLVAVLTDKDREVRRAAVIALGEIGDPGALEPLTRALKDPDPDVRRSAVIAIAELSDGHGRHGGGPGILNPNPNPNPRPQPRPRPSGA